MGCYKKKPKNTLFKITMSPSPFKPSIPWQALPTIFWLHLVTHSLLKHHKKIMLSIKHPYNKVYLHFKKHLTQALAQLKKGSSLYDEPFFYFLADSKTANFFCFLNIFLHQSLAKKQQLAAYLFL